MNIPAHTNISLSSSSYLTVEAQELGSEQFQCEKALEIMQMLDQQLHKQADILQSQICPKEKNAQMFYKFSFNEAENHQEQDFNKQKKAKKEQNEIQEGQSKAYYSSKDLSNLQSSYFGNSEKSFQQDQQNTIKNSNLQLKQLSQNSEQQKDELFSVDQISERYQQLKQLCFNDGPEKGNKEDQLIDLRSSPSEGNALKSEIPNEDQPIQCKVQGTPEKSFKDSRILNTKEQSSLFPERSTCQERFEKSLKENELKRQSVHQIIQLLSCQKDLRNNGANGQVQQVIFNINTCNSSPNPKIKVDLMKRSYISDQSQNSNQRKKIKILDLEPQIEYFNNSKAKQLGFFNYQISIINPGVSSEHGSKQGSAIKRKKSVDACNLELYYQQEARLKRLEEQLLQQAASPIRVEVFRNQKDADLLNLSSPKHEYLLSKSLTNQNFFLSSQDNQSTQVNQYVQIPQQSSSSNLILSKSQLLAPPLEESSSYLPSQECADKTAQMDEGYDLIGKKQPKQEEEEHKEMPVTENEHKEEEDRKGVRKIQRSSGSKEGKSKHMRKASRNLNGINNYVEHLELVQNALQAKNRTFKDISSPSLSSIQMEDSSRRQFYKEQDKNFIKKNKKLIQTKENKGKLDPYFEFKRQLNRNLDDYAAESSSGYNSGMIQKHKRKTTAMTQLGETSDENRSNVQKQLYQKTIEQVQQRMVQMNRR